MNDQAPMPDRSMPLRPARIAALTALLAVPVLAAPLLATPVFAKPLPPQISAVAIPDGQIDRAVAGLDAIADEIMRRSGIPGLAIAVVKGGQTVYAKGFGVRKVGDAAPVDADTVFQIASLSKSLAGSVVAHEVGAGVVAWDTPVVTHLPWFALNDPWVTQHVTIADLFSHRSGLPDHAGDNLEDFGFDRRAVLERLRLLPLDSFRNHYAYTNFGLTAAAESVAAAAGKSWEDLAETVLYRPLGMSSTSSRFADFEKRPDRAFGHVKVGDAYQPKYQRQPDAQSPAGGVSSSVNDLARWMTMVLAKGEYGGQRIIAEDRAAAGDPRRDDLVAVLCRRRAGELLRLWFRRRDHAGGPRHAQPFGRLRARCRNVLRAAALGRCRHRRAHQRSADRRGGIRRRVVHGYGPVRDRDRGLVLSLWPAVRCHVASGGRSCRQDPTRRSGGLSGAQEPCRRL